MRILIIEDDKNMALTIKSDLSKYYKVDIAHTAKDGYRQAQTKIHQAIILDLVLPDMSGLALCRKMRKNRIETPIIMLTGKGETENKVRAFDGGADDYVLKPFVFAELLARIRSLIRRQKKIPPTEILCVQDLKLDLIAKKATRGNVYIPLRKKQLHLLEYFMKNPGRTITREMILSHLWKNEVDPTSNAIDVHIKYLRDRIDKGYENKLINTVHGFGYKIGE